MLHSWLAAARQTHNDNWQRHSNRPSLVARILRHHVSLLPVVPKINLDSSRRTRVCREHHQHRRCSDVTPSFGEEAGNQGEENLQPVDCERNRRHAWNAARTQQQQQQRRRRRSVCHHCQKYEIVIAIAIVVVIYGSIYCVVVFVFVFCSSTSPCRYRLYRIDDRQQRRRWRHRHRRGRYQYHRWLLFLLIIISNDNNNTNQSGGTS